MKRIIRIFIVLQIVQLTAAIESASAGVVYRDSCELMSLFTKYGVKQYLAGHDHAREEFVQGGVKYILVDSMEEENTSSAYMIIHVEKGEINNTFHPIVSLVE